MRIIKLLLGLLIVASAYGLAGCSDGRDRGRCRGDCRDCDNGNCDGRGSLGAVVPEAKAK